MILKKNIDDRPKLDKDEDHSKYMSKSKGGGSEAQKNNVKYNKMVVGKPRRVSSPKSEMFKSAFYRLRKYTDASGRDRTYPVPLAPIIFTLWVSRKHDEVHAIKVSEIRPELIRKFFGRFVNKKIGAIDMVGNAKNLYKSKVKTAPMIRQNAYRSYKLSNIKQIFELTMDLSKLTPKNKQAKGMTTRSFKKEV